MVMVDTEKNTQHIANKAKANKEAEEILKVSKISKIYKLLILFGYSGGMKTDMRMRMAGTPKSLLSGCWKNITAIFGT